MMNTPRIAVVDDDREYADVLQQMLGSRGYDVQVFESGQSFLSSLNAPPPPDVVLMDVLMPGLDGLGTLKRARQMVPELPVIMLSGQQVPATIVDSVRAGAVDYVVKSANAEVGPATLEGAIRGALERRELATEVASLRARLADDPEGLQPCWTTSSAMRPVLQMVERVADSDVPVLLTGESGVGKEVIARELHRQSSRRTQAFVKVNCAALPLELLESELFGHERGAFTGAQTTRTGKFEFADGGSILLDEIGEMPPALQAKLLHVLQDRAVTRLGSNRTVPVDVRVIAATNRPMSELLRSGEFRSDLYYRLQVIQVHVPSLRERRSEILPLTEFFLLKYSTRYRRRAVAISPEMQHAFLNYSWPGNVRELENVVKRFVILQDERYVLDELRSPEATAARPSPTAGLDTPVAVDDVANPVPGPTAAAPPSPADGASLLELARHAAMEAERQAIQRALVTFRWNRRKAAKQLGVSYKTLLNKMKECGITEVAATSDDEPVA